MKRTTIYRLISITALAAMVLAACAPAATSTPTAPAATETTPAETPTGAATSAATTTGFVPMKVAATSCDYGGEFKSIEAVDQYTVKFSLCFPDPDFLTKVAFSVFAIQDKDYLDANQGDSVKMSQNTNGTGPYTVTEWVQGDHVTLKANPDYWGDKAKVQTLVFRWAEQPAQRLLELQAGTADGIDNPQPEDWATIQSDSNLKLYTRPPLNIGYLGFDVDIKPFDNVKVRQAIAMAIDRQRIVQQFYPTDSQPADNFVPPLIEPGYSKNIPWYSYDPAAAKKMLADAGYPNGLDVQLSFRATSRPYMPNPPQVAQEIQAELKQIGVNVTLNQMESTAFLDASAAGKLGMYLLGWNADYPGATDFYDFHFAATSNKQFGTQFPDLVKAIQTAGRTADATARQQQYDQVNTLLKQYVPMVPIAYGTSATAFKASVTGAHASPLGNEYFAVMDNGSDQLVFVQNGEPAALWCSDETDGESLRVCEQVYESLLSYKTGGVDIQPGLAQSWQGNSDDTEFTFTLRQGVKFQKQGTLDANDVVASYAAQWDAASPNHKGRTGSFEYFSAFFGNFLNAK
jgi:ABC-type transport system substrate-binding protein